MLSAEQEGPAGTPSSLRNLYIRRCTLSVPSDRPVLGIGATTAPHELAELASRLSWRVVPPPDERSLGRSLLADFSREEEGRVEETKEEWRGGGMSIFAALAAGGSRMRLRAR